MAFDDNPTLIETAQQYQVKVVVPARLFPETANNAEAFERFLQLLCDETRVRQVKNGTDDLFSLGEFNPHIVTDFEVHSIASAVQNEPFDVAIDAFRKTFDDAQAPEYLQQRSQTCSWNLAERVDPTAPDQMTELAGALFNFRISPIAAFTATAAVMAACNKRPAVQGFDNYIPISPALSKEYIPVAAAAALPYWPSEASPSRTVSGDWQIRGSVSTTRCRKPQRTGRCRHTDRMVWAARRPFSTASSISLLGRKHGFSDIMNDMLARLPKRPSRPRE